MEPSETPSDGIPVANVANRADGRPPEEEFSDAPDEQALSILRESEERISAGSVKSTDTPPRPDATR